MKMPIDYLTAMYSFTVIIAILSLVTSKFEWAFLLGQIIGTALEVVPRWIMRVIK